MLKAVADHVIAGLPDLVLGTTLQVGFRPDTAPDVCTTLQTRSGGIVENYLKHHRQLPLQILTRGLAYHATESECKRIFEFLVSAVQLSLSGFHIHTVSGITPQYLGMDSKGRHEFSANLVLRIRED